MSINENELNTNTTPNKKENIINNVKLILPKNFTIINKSRSIRKLFALERFSPKNKMFLKLKVENPTEISNKKNINNENKNKIFDLFSINNYEINNKYSLSPQNKYKKFSKYLDNNFKSLNNSHHFRHKVILPKIKIKLEENSFIKSKEASIFKGPIKGISLENLFKDKTLNDKKVQINKDQLKINKAYAKSEKNLFMNQNIKNNNKDLNLRELIFNKNYEKLFDNLNKEKNKNPAEKLKEMQLNKLKSCKKLIKKIEKETKVKKNILNNYVELMCQNIEKGFALNTNFI